MPVFCLIYKQQKRLEVINMYKIKLGYAKPLYFADYSSACDFCVMAGLRIKIIIVG